MVALFIRGMNRPGVRQDQEGSGEQRKKEKRKKKEKTDCEVLCGASTTLAVKGQVKVVKAVSGCRDVFSAL